VYSAFVQIQPKLKCCDKIIKFCEHLLRFFWYMRKGGTCGKADGKGTTRQTATQTDRQTDRQTDVKSKCVFL